MRWLSIAIVVLLSASTIPASSAGDGHGNDAHWNGYVLERTSIPNHVLIDQNFNYYSLHTGNADVIVVAFIFTTCPDVCPVITNNMIQAEDALDGVDYQFISITVDPGNDKPNVLREYREDYGATWPHLTGELEDLETVWEDFGITVITEEIQNHDHGHDHGDSMDDESVATVTVMMPNGTSNEHVVEPNGWEQLTASAYQAGWDINSSSSQWGNFVSGINNDEAPSNYSWWWELHSWNETASAWEASMLGIDDVESGPLAFAPNSTDDSSIPVPEDAHDSVFSIVQSNGSVDTTELTEFSAWHMSLGALDSFDAPDSDWGHYMNAIDGVEAPADYSWWWQLHYWNETSESWSESMVGMDSLFDESHIAWAPNSTSDELIPTPEAEIVETSTSHSTQTFILDADWKPKVVFLGYDWDVDLFVDDVKRAANLVSDPDDHDHGLPGFAFATAAAGLGLAIIASSREE
tara:strand:- start:2308 stop:3702 length:1395 start_codon:yes stop_codon:yes gene_type:complete